MFAAACIGEFCCSPRWISAAGHSAGEVYLLLLSRFTGAKRRSCEADDDEAPASKRPRLELQADATGGLGSAARPQAQGRSWLVKLQACEQIGMYVYSPVPSRKCAETATDKL